MAVYLRPGRNVIENSREVDGRLLATRVYPFGGELEGRRATMAEARWPVVGKSGREIALGADELGKLPVRWDAQLDLRYVQKEGTRTHYQILETRVDGQVLVLEDAPEDDDLAVGDQVHIREAPICPGFPLRKLLYLEHPAGVAQYGRIWKPIERLDVPPVDNLVPNPFLDEWDELVSGFPFPTEWQYAFGPSIDAVEVSGTLYAEYGESAARVICAIPGGPGKSGIRTKWIPFRPTAENPFLAVKTSLIIERGAVEMALEVDTVGDAVDSDPPGVGTNIVFVPNATEGVVSYKLNQRIEELGIVDQNFNFWELGGKKFRLTLVRLDNDDFVHTTFVLDAAQVTQTGAIPATFFYGRGSNALWHAAADELALTWEPAKRFSVTPMDRYRHDPARFPGEAIIEGMTAVHVDPQLGFETRARITEVTRDSTRGHVTQIDISTERAELTRLQAGRKVPRFQTATPYVRTTSDGDFDGELSTPTVRRVFEDYEYREYFEWPHNNVVQQDGGSVFTMDIYSTIGGLLTSGWNPTHEYSGSDFLQRQGSHRTVVDIGDESTGTYRVNNYRGVLKRSGTIVRIYEASITGYYITPP